MDLREDLTENESVSERGQRSPRWSVVAVCSILALVGLILAQTMGSNVSTNFQKVSDNLPDDSSTGPGVAGRRSVVATIGDDVAVSEPAPGAVSAGASDRDADVQGVSQVLQPADIGRSIVYVASLDVEVGNVAAASREAQTHIASLGGLLFGLDTSTQSDPRAVLTFKVRPSDFATAMASLQGLGEVQAQRVTADDVTEPLVNLQSRISTQEVSVDRLRGLLDGAGDLATIAEFETQLLERETELETVRAQV